MELDDGHIKDSVTLVLKEAKPIFVCADKKLISIAEKEGLRAINSENQ